MSLPVVVVARLPRLMKVDIMATRVVPATMQFASVRELEEGKSYDGVGDGSDRQIGLDGCDSSGKLWIPVGVCCHCMTGFPMKFSVR